MEINGKIISNGKNIEILIPNLGEFSHHGLDFNTAIYNSNFSITNVTQLEERLREMVKDSKLPQKNKSKIYFPSYNNLYIDNIIDICTNFCWI